MFEERIKKLQEIISSGKNDAFLVSSSANIFYLTGIDSFSEIEREAYLLITNEYSILFTDTRYIDGIKTKLPKNCNTQLSTEVFKIIKKYANKLGFESNLTYSEYLKFKKETKINLYLTPFVIEKIRTTKNKNEIKQIKNACNLTDKTFSYILKFIKQGVTEKEIANKIEGYIKLNGGELAFESIVAFGPNSAIPHHKTSNKRLSKSDEFILIDFGTRFNNYCSDMTRTILTENASQKAKDMYKAVLNAQEKASLYIAQNLRAGKIIKAKLAAEIANKSLNSSGFSNIPHGLGHGIGIEVHETPSISPNSKLNLTKNTVFTIEPGIYFPGFGGVRIEDDYLLSDKLVQLTKSEK